MPFILECIVGVISFKVDEMMHVIMLTIAKAAVNKGGSQKGLNKCEAIAFNNWHENYAMLLWLIDCSNSLTSVKPQTAYLFCWNAIFLCIYEHHNTHRHIFALTTLTASDIP